MKIGRKTGTLSHRYGNPNGSSKSKNLEHVQRIGIETRREYNMPKSYRHLEQMKRYAELIRNYKNRGIKSPLGNNLTASTGKLTTKQITGVDAIVSTTSTYGGIAVADFAEWVAVVKSNSGTDRALSLNLMQQLEGSLTEGSDKPTVFVCRQNVYDELWSLYQPHQRLVSEEMRSLGFDGVLEFNGKPVVVDSHASAQTMYAFNENYMYLAVHPKENFRKEVFSALETTSSMLTRLYWAGNLVCNNRRFQGKLSDIEVAS